MPTDPHPFAGYLAPEIILTAWALVLLLAEAFGHFSARATSRWAILGLGVTAAVALISPGGAGEPLDLWNHMAHIDGATRFFDLFFLATAALVIWMGDEVQAPMAHGGEFAVLPLFTTVGLMLLAAANDFILLFVALELVTISFYILVAYRHRSVTALEAGVKYLIMGGLSSAFLVLGVAYIFGFTGTTRFDYLHWRFMADGVPTGVEFGLLLVLAGIGFKIAMVPFHIWAPDVYEGAPCSITAFLSVGSKAGGLIILLRIMLGIFGSANGSVAWVPVLSVCAVLSLLLGNLAAIPQRNLKRLLGYSSIGHTGFILIAVIGASLGLADHLNPLSPDINTGQIAVNVYLVSYLLATFTGFIVLSVLEPRLAGLEIHHLAGLGQRAPLLAAAFALSLISLAGIPPMSGFIAKALVVLVAWNRHLYVLLGFTIFAAVAALYYYLGPIRAMYWSEPLDPTPIPVARGPRIALIILMTLLVLTGFWPQSMALMVNGATLARHDAVRSNPVALAAATLAPAAR
jgi:NADH-quinone oxidoreductase subunit N